MCEALFAVQSLRHRSHLINKPQTSEQNGARGPARVGESAASSQEEGMGLTVQEDDCLDSQLK